MKVLVACEFSGIVRDAFISKGHDAISCDLLDTESPGPHYKGDVRDILYEEWDLLIAHPPCTYLANSGVRWLHEIPGRWEAMRKGAAFFKELLNAPALCVCVENSIPHSYAVKEIGRKYDQLIQPWQFGHGESKSTCLWLNGLPKLKPTNIVKERLTWVDNEPDSKGRQKRRSISYPGIAEAMATQWTEKIVRLI